MEVTNLKAGKRTAGVEVSERPAEQKHALSYPGREVPSAEAVKEVKMNPSCLADGKKNSMGASADGSTKGLSNSNESAAEMGGRDRKRG